jgi:hypothetical protein
MQRTRTLAHALLMAAGLFGAADAQAQTVTGRVVDPETGETVPGAMVLLRGEDGTEQRALADSAGAYTIRARRAGSYTVSAERVGYQSAPSAPIVLAEGQTLTHPLNAGLRRVVLDVITATGRARRCDGDVRRGPEAQLLWEEARKVVASAALTEQQEELTFVTRLHRRFRRLDDSRPTQSENWTIIAAGKPFTSLTAEQLLARGYVTIDRDSATFQGIDAQAILSDAFVQHHCFSVAEAEADKPGMVGLEFMPLRGAREPDVHGVLWLDRASAELRLVEYRFTRLPYRGPVERLGGRLRFERLPSGGWIVRDWIVNAPFLDPTLQLTGMKRRARVRGLVEHGGRVVEIRGTGGVPGATAEGAPDPAPAPAGQR